MCFLGFSLPKSAHDSNLYYFKDKGSIKIYITSKLETLGRILLSGEIGWIFSTKLLDLLDSSGLCQHVTQSTHELGHTIVLIITRKSDSIIHGSPTTDHLFSDHLTMLTTLRATKPAITSKERVYRKIKSIDLDTFRNDLAVSELCQDTHEEFDELVKCYNKALTRK